MVKVMGIMVVGVVRLNIIGGYSNDKCDHSGGRC
jgi:hypothetical protein